MRKTLLQGVTGLAAARGFPLSERAGRVKKNGCLGFAHRSLNRSPRWETGRKVNAAIVLNKRRNTNAWIPVWVRVDNAYYSRGFAEFRHGRGWDYSVSVTHPNNKALVLAQLQGLPESAWEDVGLCKRAVPVRHKLQGWVEHPYVVVRKLVKGA